MFLDFYHYKKLFERPAKKSKYLISVTTYEFNSDIHKYLLFAERYKNDIYVIKYCLKAHKNHAKRYNILTQEGKCSRIIGTCLRVMLSIFKKNPNASFGFLGSHTIDSTRRHEEKRNNTKRFRVYKQAIIDLFGDEKFTHFMNIDNSTYIMVNNIHGDVEQISSEAADMFLELYPRLEGQ